MADGSMSAITVWQPWATLIALGAKPFEFRKWPAPKSLVGKRIGIHAGARPVKASDIADILDRIRDGESSLVAKVAEPVLRERATAAYARSCMLGTAILGMPQRVTELFKGAADSDRLDHHLWGWPLTDFQPYDPPLPARGAQGFWRFNPEAL